MTSLGRQGGEPLVVDCLYIAIRTSDDLVGRLDAAVRTVCLVRKKLERMVGHGGRGEVLDDHAWFIVLNAS